MRPRVLVVEDDTATRTVLRRVLEGEGCDLDVVTDGEKAVGALARRRYDAVILDLVLPKMSGTDVMESIASTSPELLASVVVITGLERKEIRTLFPSVCDTLAKPVMPGRLIAAVRRALERSSGRGSSGGSSGVFVA